MYRDDVIEMGNSLWKIYSMEFNATRDRSI